MLIKCVECGQDVSSEAVACPKCGYGVAKAVERRNFGIGCLGMLLLLGILGKCGKDEVPAKGS